MSSDNRENYRAYLLRLWRDGEESPWRASLQDPRAGETFGFASVTQLIAFIEQQTQNFSESGIPGRRIDSS